MVAMNMAIPTTHLWSPDTDIHLTSLRDVAFTEKIQEVIT